MRPSPAGGTLGPMPQPLDVLAVRAVAALLRAETFELVADALDGDGPVSAAEAARFRALAAAERQGY